MIVEVKVISIGYSIILWRQSIKEMDANVKSIRDLVNVYVISTRNINTMIFFS